VGNTAYPILLKEKYMATVTLYAIQQLTPSKNQFIRFTSVSERNAYFAEQIKIIIDDVEIGHISDWWKLNQFVTIYNNFREPYSTYNYMEIIYTNNKKMFYFINDYEEQGANQVRYNIQLDGLTTYLSVPTTPSIIFDNHSLVLREHKHRFDLSTGAVFVDQVKEAGDNTTPKIITEQTYTVGVRARLVYKNRTDSKPVAYPYVESALSVSVIGSDWIGTVYSSLFGTTETMYMWDGNFEYTFSEGTPNIPITGIGSGEFVKYQRQVLGNRELIVCDKATGNHLGVLLEVPSGRDLKIKVGNTSTNTLVAGFFTPNGTTWASILANSTQINYSASATKNLPLWTDIDSYDAMTDRIIEVPYFLASNFTFYEDGYGIFIPLESSADVGILTNFRSIPAGAYDFSGTYKNRVKYNEPKLASSQFAPVVYVMNGMSIGVKRENYDQDGLLPTINPFAFTFKYDILSPSTFHILGGGGALIQQWEEIDEFRKTWVVNNEIASIKDEAYTYNQYFKDLDDKQRQIQEASATRNAYLNTINQTLGVTGGMIAGGTATPTQLATRVGQAGINIAQTFADLADQMKMNDIQAKQKYIGLLLSSTQISGASLNFIKTFNGDKLRLLQFGLKGKELDYWDTRFYLYGYQCLEYKPIDWKTRQHFNYVEAILQPYTKLPTLTEEVYQDIARRFREGVTIHHPYTGGALTRFIDWHQTKENWEV